MTAEATKKKDRLMVTSALQDVLHVVRHLAANISDDTSGLHKRKRGSEPSYAPLKRYVCAMSLLLTDYTDLTIDKKLEVGVEQV